MLYLISNQEGQIKIGVSEDVERRLRQLQTGNASKLKIEGVYNVPDFYEKRLHHLLREFKSRHKGEWFDITPEAAIDLLGDVLPF